MSDIDIRRKHALSLAKARQAAERVAQHLRKEFGLEYRWEGDHLHFQRPGVDGRLTVSAAEVHLRAKLGMLLSFLKPQIEDKVHAHLEEALGQATAIGRRSAAKRPAKRAPRRTG